MMELSTAARIYGARILVAITTHFSKARFQYLSEVLRALSCFPVDLLQVVLVTNTSDPQELESLSRLSRAIFPRGNAVNRTFKNLDHPYDLAWCHKIIILNDFMDHKLDFTHFIYLEDDMRFTFENFHYFVEIREKIKNSRLIPAFLRTEFSSTIGALVNTDNHFALNLQKMPKFELGNYFFVNLFNPYNACFVLDQELAAEYIQTPSFSKISSEAVIPWHERERAAMGLCFESPPPPFGCRFVVPIMSGTTLTDPRSWLSHLPNTYADDKDVIFGKIRMDELFF